MSDNVRLSTKQLVVMDALLSGKTVSYSAGAVGVSERQVYRWLEPGTSFSAELSRLKAETMRLVGSRLVALAGRAVDALEETLVDPGVYGAHVRLRCAVAILELVDKWRRTEDFEERLIQIEKAVLNDAG